MVSESIGKLPGRFQTAWHRAMRVGCKALKISVRNSFPADTEKRGVGAKCSPGTMCVRLSL
jgi:hypothetical protein